MTEQSLDQLLGSIRDPAIWLRRSPAATGRSKLGGLPDLPASVEWPLDQNSGLPLHLLAQVDLAQLPPTPLTGARVPADLPRFGLLLFFADIEEDMLWGDYPGCTRVIYVAEAGRSRPAPDNLPVIGHAKTSMTGRFAAGTAVFPEARLEGYLIDSFPGEEAYFCADTSLAATHRVAASIERATGTPLPVVDDKTDQLQSPAAILRGSHNLHITRHQMLGGAVNLQGTAEAARANGDVLLLQIDTDWGLHKSFMFCDMGMAQFWIRPDDLAARRFDKAWATTEGG